MDNNIQNYRQPLVTAIGIILGFVLGFSANWATQPIDESDWSDYLIAAGLLVSVLLQIIALYRILNNQIPKELAGAHYQITLKLFIIALCFAFLGIILSIFQSIFY